MTTIVILIAALTSPAMQLPVESPESPGADRGLVVRLDSTRVLEPGTTVVRLEDVASVVADPGVVWPLVAGEVVASGDRRGVTRGLVLHRLQGAGLDADRISLVGPAVCRLTAPGAKP